MASILSNNPSPQASEQTQNPMEVVNSLANQILNSQNPNETFNQMLKSNQKAQEAMDLINKYGNGDPKTAFFNYMNDSGRQGIGQKILQMFGLGR